MYYAKHLPVPGEIKEVKGTWVYTPWGIGQFELRLWKNEHEQSDKSKVHNGSTYVEVLNKDIKPVELFLCDDMLREGDKIQAVDGSGTAVITEFTKVGANGILTYPDGRTTEGSFTHHQLENDWCKVVGKISPYAVWVLPGDRFKEDEVKIVTDTRITNIEDIDDWTHAEKETYVKWCEIKGRCTHFH